MKKMLVGILLGLMALTLTACAEIPQGVDDIFHTQALEIFIEVDDDTMELDWEGADADDIAKVNTISAMADSEREIVFSKALDKMVELQSKVIEGDREALKEYLNQRHKAMSTMNFGESTSLDVFTVPAFQFGEEE